MLENVKFIEVLSYLRRIKKKWKKNTDWVKTLGYSLEKPCPRIDACVHWNWKLVIWCVVWSVLRCVYLCIVCLVAYIVCCNYDVYMLFIWKFVILVASHFQILCDNCVFRFGDVFDYFYFGSVFCIFMSSARSLLNSEMEVIFFVRMLAIWSFVLMYSR